MKRLSLVITPMLLAACAGSPTKKTDENVIKPSYNEKVGATTLQGARAASCPTGDAYAKEDWRRVVAYANACVKSANWKQVEEIGNHLAKNAPLTPWGPYYMALAAGTRKDYPRARWMLELALKKAPGEGLFHYEMGRLAWETGDDALAIKEMKTASDMNAALTDAHFVCGQIALRRDDFSEARKMFGKALTNDSRHVAALMGAAQVEIKAKDFGKAEDFLGQVIRQNPRSSKARLALAEVQEMHLKKAADALVTYREIKQLAGQRKLDENVRMNLDEKIQALEKSLSQANQPSQEAARKPTAERTVSK